MTFRQVGNPRLYEAIVERIEKQILSGELNAGDRLPAERDLATQYGVSRTAVREAVKALRQRGLIDVFPGRGTFVTDNTDAALQRSMGLAIQLGQVVDTGALIELREILEPSTAAKAAMRATESDIERLDVLVERMELALMLPDAFIATDFEFHLALAEASHNPLLPTILNSVVDLLQVQRRRIFKSDGGQLRSQIHHRRILRAVRERDSQAAHTAMTAHLAQVKEDFEQASG